MGNIGKRMSAQPPTPHESVETFQFMEPLLEDSNNGLCLSDYYIPEEVLMMILSYVEPKQLLKLSEVCKKWFNIIRSDIFWAEIYQRECNKRHKRLPWYLYYAFFTTDYFDRNLLKNGNGEEGFDHWTIVVNYGDQFRIEDPPSGADALPSDVPEFNNKTTCFATSYYECNKLQEISFENSRLMQLILSRFRPHIYVSEWTAARFDCGCIYSLWCKLYSASIKKKKPPRWIDNEEAEPEDEETLLHTEHESKRVEQWAGSTWTKVELVARNYPSGVKVIVFEHEGRDTQFWKGHYGSKMAGGVVKILFDSIEPTVPS